MSKNAPNRAWHASLSDDDIKNAVMFYGERNEFGFLSQFAKLPFKEVVLPGDEAEFLEDLKDHTWPTAEHRMHYMKARLFGDTEIARQILSASSPKDAKTLGRRVRGWNEDTWTAHRIRIVRQTSILKFKDPRNWKYLLALLATDDRYLIEASSTDAIWGIGFYAKDAHNRRHMWGLNLLGRVLMEVRERFQAHMLAHLGQDDVAQSLNSQRIDGRLKVVEKSVE